MSYPSPNPDDQALIRQLYRSLLLLCSLAVVGALALLLLSWRGLPAFQWTQQGPEASAKSESDSPPQVSALSEDDRIENGIHLATGLVVAEGFEAVRANCTACHSGHLVAQNRASREGWLEMIRWMQQTQGLWDLAENEPVILNYLATHYAPKEEGRRVNLDVEAIEWYLLED